MHRSILTLVTLALVTVTATACDPAPDSSSSSRAQELAAELLERNPDLAVLSIDDDPERIVATDDEGQCVHVNAVLYCTADDTDEPATFGLTTPEPDPEALISQDCFYLDGYLYCGGGGGGGGCDAVDCGPCTRRSSSYTGYAEWCGCLGWVACEP